MRGSQANDPYAYDASGRVVTTSNHNGGILGGITSGMPLIVHLAVKPTASIASRRGPWIWSRAGRRSWLSRGGT